MLAIDIEEAAAQEQVASEPEIQCPMPRSVPGTDSKMRVEIGSAYLEFVSRAVKYVAT